MNDEQFNNSDLKLAKTIAQTYHGANVQVKQLTAQNHPVFRLRLQDGDKILKLAKNYQDISIPKEAMLIKMLQEQKIPVAVVETVDNTGNLFGRPFLIMDSSGEQTVLTLAQQTNPASNSLFTQMGSLLARIHQIKFSQSGDIYPNAIKPRDGQQWLQRQYQRIENLVQVGILTASEISLFKSLPMPEIKGFSLCHGDFHGVQCIVKQGKITAIVDWESAWVGNPSIDLGMTHAYLDSYCPVELIRCFFQGYLAITPLPDDYPQISMPVRMAQILGLMNTWYQSGYQDGITQALKVYRIYAQQYE